MTGYQDGRSAPDGAGGTPTRGAARRSPLRRVLRLGGIVLFVALIVLVGGFGWFANHIATLSPPAEPREADGIIVLTGGQFRLDTAVDLLRSGKGKRLLISGVNPVAGQRDLQEATGADKRLFDCCIDIDRAALDTVGNAEESAKWVRRNAYTSVILVTNNYHMPRTLLEMRRLLADADLQPYPVVNTRLDRDAWLTKPDALRVMMTEYAKYIAALARLTVGVATDEARMARLSRG